MERLKGTVKSVGRKGFGFIHVPGEPDFVYFKDQAPPLAKDQDVSFIRKPGSPKDIAVDIQLIPKVA